MPTVRKSVIVPHPASAMFALVDAVERYPEFLPWCGGTQLIERTAEVTHARIDIDYHGVKSSIETRNRNEPPEWIHLDFEEGPFERFHGHWRFVPLGGEGCRVEFALDFGFGSRSAEAILGPVIGHVMETLVDRFVARADAVART
jgi:ribosome-associated toxin RatA of RatAB toxin-antitoxin module